MRWFIFHMNNVFINVHNWSWELQGAPENGKRSRGEATGGDASELCFPLPIWRTRSQEPIVFLNGSGECTNQKSGLTTQDKMIRVPTHNPQLYVVFFRTPGVPALPILKGLARLGDMDLVTPREKTGD